PDCPDRPDCPVKTAGRHTVVVRDSMNKSTGDYALYLQRADDPAGCGRIASEAVDGTLQPPGSMACAFFTAAGGDRVNVSAVGTGDGLLQFNELSIISVDTGRTSCSSQSNCQFDQAARYIVLGASSSLVNQTV